MVFLDSVISVKILSVLELSWDAGKRYAKPRPFNALSYRITGNADFIHNNKIIHVNQDDIAFVPADYNYGLNSEAEHLYVAHFDINGHIPKEMEVFTPLNANIFENLFHSMYVTWNSKQPGYQFAAASLFYKAMEQLQKQHIEKCLFTSSQKFKYVIEYIHEHFADSDLSIARISEMAGMSDTYIRKLFKNNFSVTPQKYISNLRISYAEELLRSGYYTVEQAAEKSGFSDPKYFSTVVKKAKGLSPSKLYTEKDNFC